jgi:prepilin-type N-terminal cleavage/methylation domain-containing protein
MQTPPEGKNPMQHLRKAKDEGFTLIELLIVIIILGILAAIVVFAVGTTRSDSIKATCKTDVKSIQLAAEAYKTKNGAYPVKTTGAGGTSGQAKLTDGTVGGTLKGWPGGTSATNDDLVLAYSAGGADTDGTTYTIAVTGKNFSGATHTVTDLSPDSGTGSPTPVDTACTTN